MSLTDFFSFINPSLSWARACKKHFYQLSERKRIHRHRHRHHFLHWLNLISRYPCVVQQMETLIVHQSWARRNRNPQLRDSLTYGHASTLKRYYDNLTYCCFFTIFCDDLSTAGYIQKIKDSSLKRTRFQK